MSKLVLVLAAAVAALSMVLSAQERAVLVTPQVTSVTEYRIRSIHVQFRPHWSLSIEYEDNLGRVSNDRHSGSHADPDGADALVTAFGTANLEVKSLETRALEHLEGDGRIPRFTIVKPQE